MATDSKKTLSLLKKVFEAAAPDLRKSMAMPRRAQVTSVCAAGGTYTCSVQAVLNDGRPDPAAPVIPDVEIPSLWAGADRGVICPPNVGEFCDLGFYDGDPNCPYISNFRPSKSPEAELGSFIIQHSPGIKLGFKPDGTVIIEAPKIEATATEYLKSKAPLVEIEAADQVEITAPLVRITGCVEVSGGIFTSEGAGGSGMEVAGQINIVRGGLKAEQNLEAGGSVIAGSNVTASGKVEDQGGNTNHHTH